MRSVVKNLDLPPFLIIPGSGITRSALRTLGLPHSLEAGSTLELPAYFLRML